MNVHKNILITGGSSGLGLALLNELAPDETNNIWFTFFSNENIKNKLEAKYTNVNGVFCDFLSSKSVNDLETFISKLDLDCLINCAWTGFEQKHFHKIQSNELEKYFSENVIPTIQITNCVFNLFKKKKFGTILTILTSYLNEKPPLGLSNYVACKAYLESMTKSWAVEGERYNISSMSLSPTTMATNFLSNLDPRLIENLKNQMPNKDFVDPIAIALLVCRTLNSRDLLNGQNILAVGTHGVI